MQTVVFVLYLKDYTLEGEFGKATDNFTDTGRVIEKTTYGNVCITISYLLCIVYRLRICSKLCVFIV